MQLPGLIVGRKRERDAVKQKENEGRLRTNGNVI